MCSAPLATVLGLPWPWSLPVVLVAAVPIVVGLTIAVVLIFRLTSRRDRRRFVTLVCQQVGRWLP